MKCEKIPTCIFYNDKMEKVPELSEMIKGMFCLGNKFQCGRYLVAQKFGKVPDDLSPVDSFRTEQILGNL